MNLGIRQKFRRRGEDASAFEAASIEFKLLITVTAVTVLEAIGYARVEVLLYTSVNPLLYNAWLLGHFTTYHLFLGLIVVGVFAGVVILAKLSFSPPNFWRFAFIAAGNFLLWLMLEDEFTFIFSGSPHTATDWTNWPIGSVHVLTYYVPTWYFLSTVGVLAFWYLGLTFSTRRGRLEIER